MLSLTLDQPLCLLAEGFISKDLIGKQAFLPRSVDIFLSYSVTDRDQARHIFDHLDKAGVSVFLAERDLSPGDVWEDAIRDALVNCSTFWMLVSPNSLKSEWVTTEWAAAWALNKRIVPVLFRCTLEDLPSRLRAHQCIDFHQVADLSKAAILQV